MSAKNWSPSANGAPLRRPPFSSKVTIVPKSCICCAASACCGWVGVQGSGHGQPPGAARARWRCAPRSRTAPGSARNRSSCPRRMRKAACGSSMPPSTPKSLRMARMSSVRPITAPPMHVARTGGVLGEAVQEQVHLVLAVLMEAGEGIVHHRQSARRMRQARKGGHVGDLGDRIGGAFEKTRRVGSGRQRALHALQVLDRQHRVLTPKRAEQAANQIARRIVGLDEAQHVIALLGSASSVCAIAPTPLEVTRQSARPCSSASSQLELARGRDWRCANRRIPDVRPAGSARFPRRSRTRTLPTGRSAPPAVGCRGQLHGGRMIDAGGLFHGQDRGRDLKARA